MHRWLAVVVLVACGGTAAKPDPQPQPKPIAVDPELRELRDLAWWVGDWVSVDGNGTEHWVAAGGALYGVALRGATYEVMIVDDDDDGEGKPDGTLRFFAMPGGAAPVQFTRDGSTDRLVRFADPAHDDPKAITYARVADDRLVATVSGAADLEFAFTPATIVTAPALEAADRAFAADTAARGVDGWVAAFEENGVLVRDKRIVGRRAIGDAIEKTLTGGLLAWEPIVSRMSSSGNLGFTVGKATWTRTGDTAPSWRGTYVTIWRQQPDDTWKVAFDTGRSENAAP
jgi:ketosteroid isomerase-like protein